MIVSVGAGESVSDGVAVGVGSGEEVGSGVGVGEAMGFKEYRVQTYGLNSL